MAYDLPAGRSSVRSAAFVAGAALLAVACGHADGAQPRDGGSRPTPRDGGSGPAPHDGGAKHDAPAVGSDSGGARDAAPATFTPCNGESSDGGVGTLLFNGDFETGDLSAWLPPPVGSCTGCFIQGCLDIVGAVDTNGRITVYSKATAAAGAPAPRQGTYAAHFHVLNGDVIDAGSCQRSGPGWGPSPTDNPRAQLVTHQFFTEGEEVWESLSVYIPAGFPAVACAIGPCPNGEWLQYQEDYGPPYHRSPATQWGIGATSDAASSDYLFMQSAPPAYDKPWRAPIITGAWFDLLVHKRFSVTPSVGFMEAWIDNVPVTFSVAADSTTPGCASCTRLELQTLNDAPDASETTAAFILNIYRAVGMFDVADMYFDAMRVGTTCLSLNQP
jgi:Polysaccharide lyase